MATASKAEIEATATANGIETNHWSMIERNADFNRAQTEFFSS
jgi:hypothetical protein